MDLECMGKQIIIHISCPSLILPFPLTSYSLPLLEIVLVQEALAERYCAILILQSSTEIHLKLFSVSGLHAKIKVWVSREEP